MTPPGSYIRAKGAGEDPVKTAPPGSSNKTKAVAEDLFKGVPFHLVFRADDGSTVKTNAISSEKIAMTTPLGDLRVDGNLWVLPP